MATAKSGLKSDVVETDFAFAIGNELKLSVVQAKLFNQAVRKSL